MCSFENQSINEELISLMKEAGMTRILFGLENFSRDILISYGRDTKEDRIEYFSDLLRTIDEYGIATRCSYMVGEINETEGGLKKCLELFKQIVPDEMSIKILTPFPGTSLFQKYENTGLILHKDWREYGSMTRLVFKHPSLSENTLKKYQYEITKQYFESDEYKRHVKQKIKKHPHLRQSFFDYFDKIKAKGINVRL